ncbi:MAG TPA: hypothetical protein VFO80_13120 [Sphingomonas sp.]|nr:hypothetical protein [Sphingomonas sp.]
MSADIMNDLGRKISAKLQEDLQREMNIATKFLEPSDAILLIMKIAAGISGGAICAALQIRRDEIDVDEMWGVMHGLIRDQTDALKPDYLKALRALEAVHVPGGVA